MLETRLSVVLIETDDANEARDLFIRLQAGMPLNPQEKRDAWPGHFTEYILKLAGKPEAGYQGHEFFTMVMNAKTKNRGQFRQLAAQMVMLYLTRRQPEGKLCDIGSDAIDDFYHKNLDFDSTSREAVRFLEILGLLAKLLGDGKRKPVIRHEAIGLVLLVDSLWDDYTRSWTSELASAFDKFRLRMKSATKNRLMERDEYWLRYGEFTRAHTDQAENIERRHSFFAERMHAELKPRMKDPNRNIGELERELIYDRDKKRCQVPGCDAEVPWSEAEIHHVELHSQGGATTIDNGALVCKRCHPKSPTQVAAFAEHWKTTICGKAAAEAFEGNSTLS